MLRISKMADYATVIMGYLANKKDYANTREIAENTKIAPPTVSKLLKTLTKTKLLHSTQGVFGGYGLTSSPNQITMLDIIQSVEGEFNLTPCCEKGGLCSIEAHCGVKDNWQVINLTVLKALKAISLADLSDQDFAKNLLKDFYKQ